MICVSLKETDPQKCLQILKKIDFAEIRLDKMGLSPIHVRKFFSQHPKLIATYRIGTEKNPHGKNLLMSAIEAGAAYVDIEVEAHDEHKTDILQKARSHRCKVIISYHNYERTPSRSELKEIVNQCFEDNPDITKVACQVHSSKDNVRILELLSDTRSLVVIGMGQLGKITRIVAPLLGSLFTYASLDRGEETAEGQINHLLLRKILKSLNDA
jgi:3-dehydroquinate dehydratase type I